MKTIISLINVIDSNGIKLSHMYQYKMNNLYTAFYITLYNIIGIKIGISKFMEIVVDTF